MKVIVIGGGASGLVAAITAKRNNHDVLILEKNNQIGKKLKLTGNGRCNYYNDDQNLTHYHSNTNDLVSKIITKKTLDKIPDFFQSIGVIPKIKDGYYYPYSNQAITIVESLLLEIKKLNIKIIYDIEVESIEKKDSFIINTNKEKYYSDKVIIATGGMSYKKTGSDGKGYEMLKKLGHTTTEILPGLTPVIAKTIPKEWAKIRTDAKLTLYENNEILREELGEVQLTDNGISGICAMQLSSLISKGLFKDKQELITINFLPFLKESFLNFMENRNQNLQDRTIIELLEGILHYKLLQAILRKKQNLLWSNLSSEEKTEIETLLTKYPLEIIATKDYESAQTTIGGIKLSEINPKTMESNLIEGLYITGELLDLNGDCGGYNLTIAWLSGICAGEAI